MEYMTDTPSASEPPSTRPLTTLPSRYTKKQGRPYSLEKLLDAHVIGLLLDDNLEYKPEQRSGAHHCGEGTPPENAAHRKRNYAVFRPYGEMGVKMFFHGKDLFTEEAAQKYYGEKAHSINLINPAVIERIEQAYSNESFRDRAESYLSAYENDMGAMIKLSFDLMKIRYPKLDISSLGEMPSETPQLIEFFRQAMPLMEKQGVNLIQIMQEAQTNPAQFLSVIYERIKTEMPVRLESYLSQASESQTEEEVKQRWGAELKTYMQAHEWDWEILNNFKAAVSGVISDVQDLPVLLKRGRHIRAEQTALNMANQIYNPYDKRFAEIEPVIARTIVDSVQPQILNNVLNSKGHNKCMLLFASSTALDAFSDHIRHFIAIQGQYNINMPSTYFDNFIACADHGLDHDRLAWLIRHECEHKLDLDKGLSFASQYKDNIPAMITADVEALTHTKEFVHSIQDNSTSEDNDKLISLGRRRGIKAGIMEITHLRDGLLRDIESIETRLSVFASQLEKKKTKESAEVYNFSATQWLEIPAIMEELKGQYGRSFIRKLLPELSEATNTHRKQALASSNTAALG